MVYHKYVNLFFCTSKNSKAYAFMYAFFPIGYRTLSTECPWFSLFFLQHTIRIVLFWGMFLTQEIEKSLMLSCIKLCVTCVSLRGGCVCVCVYTLPPVGFFRLHNVFDIREKFRSTIFCCEYSDSFCQAPSSLFLNLSYFTSKDENSSHRLTGEKTI